jgi:hypothetical protein
VEKRSACMISVGKIEGQRPLGRTNVGEWIIVDKILERWDNMV